MGQIMKQNIPISQPAYSYFEHYNRGDPILAQLSNCYIPFANFLNILHYKGYPLSCYPTYHFFNVLLECFVPWDYLQQCSDMHHITSILYHFQPKVGLTGVFTPRSTTNIIILTVKNMDLTMMVSKWLSCFHQNLNIKYTNSFINI